MIYKRNVLEKNIFDDISKNIIFEKDNYYYKLIRENIELLIDESIKNYTDKSILEVGPKHGGDLRIKKDNILETVDIEDNDNNNTYCLDLTKENIIPKNYYDVIYCLEVLEHTFEPSDLLNQLNKLLKKNGILYISVPFQFRIHGPLPDCYRITEIGLKYLIEKNNFEIIEFNALTDDERPAFPIHYTIMCKKI